MGTKTASVDKQNELKDRESRRERRSDGRRKNANKDDYAKCVVGCGGLFFIDLLTFLRRVLLGGALLFRRPPKEVF